MNIDVISALLCDLIRQENNGKFIAIGIYSSSVSIGTFPSYPQFSLLAQVRPHGTGIQRLEFRVLISGEESQRLVGDFEATRINDEWIPVQLQPVNLQVPGELTIEHLKPDSTWVEFFRIKIERPPGA